MKKLIMALVLIPLMVLADTEKVGDVTWTFRVSSEQVSVKGADPCAGKLEIPATLGNCPVTSIGADAFFDCSDLTEVVIPEGVTSIGDEAFCDCRGLTAITIPSSIVGIGEAAFEGCDSLATVKVSADDVEDVKKMLVESNSGLDVDALTFFWKRGDGGPYTEVVNGIEWTFMISEGKAAVGSPAVPRETVGAIEIPSTLGCCPVTSIGGCAFEGCSGLVSVTIPEGVTSIGGYAFEGCSGLVSVTIPEGVTSIGDYAFYSCYGLVSVTIPASVKNIGHTAFWACNRLRRVNFPGAVPGGWTSAIFAPATKFYYNKDYATEWEKAQKDAGIPGEGTPYDVKTSAIVPQVAGCVTVSNIVVHYILNSVQPEFAIKPADDMNFVNIITEVKGSAVAIPETWAANYPGFAEKFGEDFTQALMKPTGKIGTGGTPMLVWQDYVAGTDPTNEKDVFTASITIVDGKVTISYSPELDDTRKAMRKYTTWGKKSLLETAWTEVQEGHEAEYNFFKVSVEMR